MPIIDLFSKRQKKLRGEVFDVYFYDKLPNDLRVQIVHIIRDVIGEDLVGDSYYATKEYNPYKFIHQALCREYGVFSLGKGHLNETDESCVLNFFLQTNDVEKAIDVIEITFKYVIHVIKNPHHYQIFFKTKIGSEAAILELNDRFKEHGFGYQLVEDEIIRVDSTYVHSEITKPTISLLNKSSFSGANEEYLKAHEHYRHGRNKECLNDCLKAFESTMKIILSKKGWSFNPTDTAKKLIQVCFQNNLVPTFTQNQFTSFNVV